MVNEFKLAVVHFACPNSMQTCACAWINRWTKNGGKSGPGRRAIMGRGSLGRRGPRAVGLFLVKPFFMCFIFSQDLRNIMMKTAKKLNFFQNVIDT